MNNLPTLNDNPAIPNADLLFKPTMDAYGTRLALVFGNEYKEGKCPFVNQCGTTYCDIGQGEGTQFTPEKNRERLDFFRNQYSEILQGVEHLVLYNSGSVLNRNEFSQETLGDILEYFSSLQECKVISLDSREMYITNDTLDYIVNQLRQDQQPRVIIGIETQNDQVRIRKLKKIMTKEAIKRAFQLIGAYNQKVGVDINILFQPPGLMGEDAIEEAVKTAELGLDLAQEYNVPIDINFHAYYPSESGKKLFPNHPRASIKDELKAIRRIRQLIFERNSNSQLFLGGQDEVHDQEQSLRKIEDTKFKVMFDQFNKTQNIELLNN